MFNVHIGRYCCFQCQMILYTKKRLTSIGPKLIGQLGKSPILPEGGGRVVTTGHIGLCLPLHTHKEHTDTPSQALYTTQCTHIEKKTKMGNNICLKPKQSKQNWKKIWQKCPDVVLFSCGTWGMKDDGTGYTGDLHHALGHSYHFTENAKTTQQMKMHNKCLLTKLALLLSAR